MTLWQVTKFCDPAVVRLADSHYSRRKPGSWQFTPPGKRLVLYVPGPEWPFRAWAGWVWWHPHENLREIQAEGKPLRMDGFDGWWNCCFFRNESPYLSSKLIREAVQVVNKFWSLPPRGYDTWVWPEKLSQPVQKYRKPKPPGYCYLKAGWQCDGHWSKDGQKLRLFLPVE